MLSDKDDLQCQMPMPTPPCQLHQGSNGGANLLCQCPAMRRVSIWKFSRLKTPMPMEDLDKANSTSRMYLVMIMVV